MERARQAQTKRVVSPTDETREEGITPLLSVSFFLARPSTRPWDVFVQCVNNTIFLPSNSTESFSASA